MPPKYKLTYFDFRARAELIRYIFTETGTEFIDNRITFEQWPAVKKDAPYGQAPFLEFDGKKMAQSRVIAMYLAEKFGLVGKSLEDKAYAAEIVMLGEDMFVEVVKPFFEKDEKKKAELMKKLAEETVPKFCGFFEQKLKDNKSDFMVGNKFSVADLAVYYYLDNPVDQNKDLLNAYPKLKAHREMVGGRPKIKAYVAKRDKDNGGQFKDV